MRVRRMVKLCLCLLAVLLLTTFPTFSQTAIFEAPDTVCVNTPVQVSNVLNASSYYWNFCVSNVVNSLPTGVNLGNFGGALSYPVFSDFVESNGNYYLFVVNHFNPSGLVRLNFGSSPLNTPTVDNLGNFSNTLGSRLQGIQVLFDQGIWYAFIVGGDPDFGDVPQFVRLNFGSNIENNTPAITNFGNIGNLYHPLDLFMFNENNQWHGFTVNKNGTVTRFAFPNGLNSPATGQNYNTGLNFPVGINQIYQNGSYYVFVTERYGNSIKRMDFGNSLLHNPTIVDLGNPGNLLEGPADLTIVQFCDDLVGFTINGSWGSKANQLIRLDFNKDIESIPTGTTLGNVGSLSNPHSISKLFRVEDKVYSFVTNVGDNPGVNTGLTRLEFPGCTNSNIPGSSVQTPPPITYDAPGVYNINLTTDIGLPTQSSYCKQVVVVPAPVHIPLQTIYLRAGETVRLGTAPSFSYQWLPGGELTDSIDVNTPGFYIVENGGFGCSNRDSFLVVIVDTDFSFQQDICDPYRFTFKNETSNTTVVSWNFGDGSPVSTEATPQTRYPSTGDYTVILTVRNNSTGLEEMISKQIPVELLTENLITTSDTTICWGASLQLNAINAIAYCWFPPEGLSNTTISNPIASPTSNTTYYLHALIPGNNLVSNGDFSQGNSRFTSSYLYAATNTATGQYNVGNNPIVWNNSLASCQANNGNILMVQSTGSEEIVWSQTIDVTPNTNYIFSTGLQTLSEINPANLMFAINGNTVGDLLAPTLPVCTQTLQYAAWNSGNNTIARIAIINKNTIPGSFFALDNIQFAPYAIKRDSINISVEAPEIIAGADTTICAGSAVELSATGAFTNYLWTGINIAQPTSSHPVVIPSVTGEFIVTGTTANGCTDKDTTLITVLPAPVVELTDNTAICYNATIQLEATGGNIYNWFPTEGLNDPNIGNPIASPLQSTTYFVEVLDHNNCSNIDSVVISIVSKPKFEVTGDTTICTGTSLQLTATGGTVYQWSPASDLSNSATSAPLASPISSTIYEVYIRENSCNYDTTLQVQIAVSPTPLVTATSSNNINCSVRTTQLTATGASSYNWRPAPGLNNANIPNPVGAIDSSTLFTVRGTNEYGCYAEDTVLVRVTTDGDPLFLVPNAFTPNNDGVNDCLSIRKWGLVDLQEFSIYNRSGEKIFSTTNQNDCWNGTHKGIQQPSGTFVYVIRAKTFCGNIFRKGTVTLIR